MREGRSCGVGGGRVQAHGRANIARGIEVGIRDTLGVVGRGEYTARGPFNTWARLEILF